MESRKHGTDKSITDQKNLSLTKFSGFSSDFKNMLNQTLRLVQDYFFRPQQPIINTNPKTKSRAKTKYEDNVTAALSLSNGPKQKVKCGPEKKIEIYATPSSMQVFTTSLFHLFWHAKNEQKEINPSSKIKDNQVTVNKKKKMPGIKQTMIKLVEEFKELKDPEGADKDEAEAILIKQVDLVEHEIIEHAQRRVDLYFYLLVAVYKQQAIIEKKSTDKQHGIGNNQHGTHAAHDSLFPNVKLKHPKTIGNAIWSIFTTLPSFKGTHFEDSSNMTVELPSWVNKFDTYLELATPGRPSAPSAYVNNCISDLNLASFGKITPIDGMNRFIKNIKHFFKVFEEKYLIDDKPIENNKITKRNEIERYPKLMKRIWELQYMGTLKAQAFESDTIDTEYLCSLLRAQYSDKVIQDPSSLLGYCKRLQKEIFNTPSITKPKTATTKLTI